MPESGDRSHAASRAAFGARDRERNREMKKTPEQIAGGWEISGRLEVTEDAFMLTLDGVRTDIPPTEPPDTVPPELPEGAIVIEPTGGDDTQLLRDAVGNLPEGGT